MWSAAEPCRTRMLSLEMQEPPSERDVTGCCGGGAPVSTQPATHGMAQKVPLDVRQKTLGQRQQSRGRDGQDGGSQPRAACPSRGDPCPHLRQLRPRWLSWSWVRPDRALLTEETVEAPRVMRMRPLSSKRAVLL